MVRKFVSTSSLGTPIAVTLVAAFMVLGLGCGGDANDTGASIGESDQPEATSTPNPTATPRMTDTAANENGSASASLDLDASYLIALDGSESKELVVWEVSPKLTRGRVSGSGTLSDGARLFDTLSDEGAAMAIYVNEVKYPPLVVPLPRLSGQQVWETELTVGPTDLTIDGQSFAFDVFSPIFFDANPGDLTLRVFGYDARGETSVLAEVELE